jgi:methyl-accepting chemotaxis protein
MSQKMKVSTKLYTGFMLVLTLMVVVGIIGYVGISNTVETMNSIVYQLDIAEKVNEVLTDAQNAQGNALRFIIYKDNQYSSNIAENAEAVYKAAQDTMALAKTQENKALAQQVIDDMRKYAESCRKYADLEKEKAASGSIRAEMFEKTSADMVRVLEFAQAYVLETDKEQMVDRGAVERTWYLNQCRDSFATFRATAQSYLLSTDPQQQETLGSRWVAEVDESKAMLQKAHSMMASQQTKDLITSAIKSLDGYRQQVLAFRRCNDQQGVEQAQQRQFANAVTAQAAKVRDVVYDLIDNQKKEAETQVARANALIISISAAAIAVGMTLAFFITRGIVKPIRKIVLDLTNAAEQVASASGQVSASSQSLAEGATEQAAGLEETSSSLEEMSSMTKQNADNAQQANVLANDARKAAEGGAESMERMSRAIDDIQKSSDETARIIKVIDEIAFQTNLLALNAAVEAARAGEAGKGFAVVAEEVRNLAMRSAEAAKNTANMIEGSVKNAQNGVEISGEVSKALGDIVGAIAKTNDLVGEIAAASQEQSQGIDQVNTAVAQMDKVTQQNAANAEESASASEELSSQAEQMQGIVNDLVRLVEGASAAGAVTRSDLSASRKRHKPALKRDDQIFHQIAEQPVSGKPQAARAAIPMEDFTDFNN